MERKISQNGAEVHPSLGNLGVGGMAEKAAAIFRSYDIEGRLTLDHESMMSALAELGVLNGLTAKKLGDILAFGTDVSVRNRTYNFQEFFGCCERLASFQAKAARLDRIKALSKMPGIPEGAESNELVRRTFTNYCMYTVGQSRLTYDGSDPKMSSTQFVKLCQDLGLVQPNGPLNVVTIDIIFHKCKPVGGRRFNLPHYVKALAAVAEDSGLDVFERVAMLGEQIKPRSSGFVAPPPVVFRQETRAYSNHLPGIMTVPGSAPGGGRLAGDPFASAREGKEAAAAAAKIRKPPPEAWGPNDSDPPPPWVTSLMERVEDLELQVEMTDKEGTNSKRKMGGLKAAGRAGQSGGIGEDKVGAGKGSHRSSSSGGAAGDGRACEDAATVALDLAELERRVQGCEKADHLLQVGLSGVGQQVPRAVDDALAAQLGAHLMRLMGPGGDMAAAVKATVDAAMAGSVQRLKELVAGERQAVQRLEALEAKSQAADVAAQKATRATEVVTKRVDVMEQQQSGCEAGSARPQGGSATARLQALEGAALGHDKSQLELSSRVVQALAVAQGQGTKFDARIGKLEGSLQLLQADVDSLRQGKGLLGGAAAMLRADRQPSLIDPDTQLKFEALGKQQGSDAARLGATVAKLTMRQELLEQKSGSSVAALAILEAEVKARLAELEASDKALEFRLVAARETFEQHAQQQALQLNSKLSQLSARGANEERTAELERRVEAGSKAQADLVAMLLSLRAGQEAIVSSTVWPGPAGEEARLAVIVQGLQNEVGGFKADYNDAMGFIKGDFEKLHSRLLPLESDQDSHLVSYAPIVELKELENHLMARMRLQSDELTTVQKTVNTLIEDISKVSTKVSGSLDAAVLRDIQSQLQGHLDSVYQDILSQLETRWASKDAMQLGQDRARGNHEAILGALKELDKRHHDSVAVREDVMLRMARQIDSIQNYLRQQDTSFSSAPSTAYSLVSVQQGGSALSPFLAAAQQQQQQPGGAGMGCNTPLVDRRDPPVGPRESRDLVSVGSAIKGMRVQQSLNVGQPR